MPNRDRLFTKEEELCYSIKNDAVSAIRVCKAADSDCNMKKDGDKNLIKGTPELIDSRRTEIVDACEKLYETMSYKEITIKEIAKETSFGRTSIYNYFLTKEEIFLALFQKEWDLLADDLEQVLHENEPLAGREFADAVARAIEKRTLLLRLLSVDFYDFESNCREEMLVDQKKSFYRAFDGIRQMLRKFFPDFSETRIEKSLYSFFPILYGIYPYTFVEPQVSRAVQAAEINFGYMTIHQMVCNSLTTILGIYD